MTLFVRHTSCSLAIQENADPEVQGDLTAFFDRLVPPSDHPAMAYLRHTYEGPDDMPAHIKAALLPVSLSIPVMAGRPLLGTWQGVYLFEHRRAPHDRQVVHISSGKRRRKGRLPGHPCWRPIRRSLTRPAPVGTGGTIGQPGSVFEGKMLRFFPSRDARYLVAAFAPYPNP